jgi:hypothetical protein
LYGTNPFNLECNALLTGWLGGAGYILLENKNVLERKIVHILLRETEIQEKVML